MKKIIFILFAILAIVSCDLHNQNSDSLSDSLSDLAIPVNDISISAIETTPSAKRGDILTVGIIITNSGTNSVDQEFEISLDNQSEGEIIGNKTLTSGLAPQDSIKVSYRWNTGNVTPGTQILVAKHTFEDDNPANNSLQSTITVSETDIIDITLSEVRLPNTIEEGNIVDVEVDLKNIGNQNVNETITIELSDLTDGKTIGIKKIDGEFTQEDSKTFTYSWDTEGYSIGDHQLSAIHDFADGKTDNNTFTTSVTINEAPFIDIAVTSLEAPSEATQGDNVKVKMTIENRGNQDVDETITITLVDQTDGTTIDSESISGGLDAEAAKSITFNWNTNGTSPGDHRLAARHLFDDDNSENNSKTIEIRVNEEIFLDIAISTIDAPLEVEKGDKVRIEVKLSNLGNSNVNEDIMVTLANQTDNKTISSPTLKGGLKIGSSKTVKFLWNTRGRVREGKHTLIVHHNFEDDNLVNNSRAFEIEVEDD